MLLVRRSMVSTLVFHLGIVLLYMLLYKTRAEPNRFRCFFPLNETENSSFIDVSGMKEAADRCARAVRITLLNGDTFDTMNISEEVLNWILEIDKVDMCFLIQRTAFERILVRNRVINGSCAGPLLSVINNDNLETLTIEENLLENYVGVLKTIVVVRGNQKLSESSINRFKNYSFVDLQREGDITGNKLLCISNLRYVTTVFGNITLSENKELCEHCLGGDVTEEYLRLNFACKHVYGDLKIAGWRDKPAHISVLMGFKSIHGRLVIANNRNMFNFPYFPNLTTVGRMEDEGPAIIVKDNLDLTELPLPQVKDLKNYVNKSKILLVNNPKLRISSLLKSVQEEETTRRTEHGSSPESKKAKEVKAVLSKAKIMEFSEWYVVGGAAFLCLLFLLTILLVTLRRKPSSVLPELPSKISKRSEALLSSICKEIVSRCPMAWFREDGDLLWKSGSKKADSKQSVSLNQNLKSHMLNLCQNAALPFVKRIHLDKLLQKRVQSFLDHDYVLLIGTTGDVKRVVPHLPFVVGGSMLYFDSPADISLQLKLLQLDHVSKNIFYLTYEAGDVRQKAETLKVLYYEWGNHRFPNDFDELLQLLLFTCDKDVICASNRRKELFSLLHLFFVSVMKLKEPLRLAELFQFHLHNCNGAPLDRDEMVIAMRTMLEWARKVSAVPSEIKDMCANWCKLYEKMFTFSMDHRNIMHIHAQHISDDAVWLKKATNGMYSSAGSLFSERSYSLMKDKYRRLKIKKSTGHEKTMHRVRGLSVSSATGTASTSVSTSSCTTASTSSNNNLTTTACSSVSTSSTTKKGKSSSRASTVPAWR